MNAWQLKRAVAQAALAYVAPQGIIGVGTGSTVDCFIEALGASAIPIQGAISSSHASTTKLQALGIPVYASDTLTSLDLYIDGADEVDPQKQLIKGGGAALTGEKIVAALAKRFICIVDQSKQVAVLGQFPLPVEVIPMARAHVASELTKLGGFSITRQNVRTDHGNIILDVHRLRITDPVGLESCINNIAGVVTVGLFAHRSADIVLIATPDGIQTVV